MKTIMRTRLVPILAKALQPLGLMDGKKTLLLGVSGGADSVALLHGMVLLREAHDFSLAAVHVEHGLRGEESLKDASFVEALCRALDVPLALLHVDAKAAMAEFHCGQEEAARILRYRCFAEAMASFGADVLLLAHHADDQAETVLMHLMRGSGPTGLGGMRVCTAFHGRLAVRPLLSLRHEELCSMLAQEGLPWREDLTNREPGCLRNKLRLEVMPSLLQLSPGCVEAMGRAAQVSGDEEDWWHRETAGFLKKHAGLTREYCFLDRAALGDQPVAYRRRVLRAFWDQALCAMGVFADRGMTALSFDKLQELLDCLNGHHGKAVNLPLSIRGEITAMRFFLIKPEAMALGDQAAVSLPGQTRYHDVILKAEPWQTGMETGDGIRRQALDVRFLEGAVLRTRQIGDVFPLMGGEGTQPLKETLIDRHVDRPFRDHLPILAKGAQVLWIPGVGPSGAAMLRPDTQSGMLFTLEGRLPWEITTNDKENLL